jgi:hypothetical protein
MGKYEAAFRPGRGAERHKTPATPPASPDVAPAQRRRRVASWGMRVGP